MTISLKIAAPSSGVIKYFDAIPDPVEVQLATIELQLLNAAMLYSKDNPSATPLSALDHICDQEKMQNDRLYFIAFNRKKLKFKAEKSKDAKPKDKKLSYSTK